MSPLLERRLPALEKYSLKSGSHSSLRSGACALELVSYLAGEPWSDHPECVCPTLGAFFRSWNDGLPSDAERDRLLKPFLPRLIGTRGTPKMGEARGVMALDWLVRVYTPTWLDLRPELQSHAQALRALEALRDWQQLPTWEPSLDAVRSAVRSAAESAAGSAAGSAAWLAAGLAAGSAAWLAAGLAAGSAAGSAAWLAAGSAVRSAAWSAAESALLPTVAVLQTSAVDLADRMIRLTDADL